MIIYPPWASGTPWKLLPPKWRRRPSIMGRANTLPPITSRHRVIFQPLSLVFGQFSTKLAASSFPHNTRGWRQPFLDASTITTPLNCTFNYTIRPHSAYLHLLHVSNITCSSTTNSYAETSSSNAHMTRNIPPASQHHATLYRAQAFNYSTTFATTMSTNNANASTTAPANAAGTTAPIGGSLLRALLSLSNEEQAKLFAAYDAAQPPSTTTATTAAMATGDSLTTTTATTDSPTPSLGQPLRSSTAATLNDAMPTSQPRTNGQEGMLSIQHNHQRLNQTDFDKQTAVLSNNATLQTTLGRPGVYIHFKLDPQKSSTLIHLDDVAQVMQAAITNNLPNMEVDILSCDEINLPSKQNQQNQSVRGVIVLSPRSSASFEDESYRTPSSDFAKLNDFAFDICNANSRTKLNNLHDYITNGTVTFFLEPVNAGLQQAGGIIVGFPATVFGHTTSEGKNISDIQAHRQLAIATYKAAASFYVQKDGIAPPPLQCTDDFLITSALSTKPLYTDNKQDPSLIAVSFNNKCSHLAALLDEAFSDTTSIPLTIPLMDGRATVLPTIHATYASLAQPPPNASSATITKRNTNNARLITAGRKQTAKVASETVIVPNVQLSVAVLLDPDLLPRIASSFKDCVAIIPTHQLGRSSPTFNWVFRSTFTTKQLTPATIADQLRANPSFQHLCPSDTSTSTTAKPPTSSYATAAAKPPTYAYSTNTSIARLSQSSYFSDRNTGSKQYYVVMNGKGGGALAGVYFDNWDSIKKIVEGVSFARAKKVSSQEEGLNLLREFYPSINSLEDIQKWNNETPLEETNLTNRSPEVQARIINYRQPHHSSSNLHVKEFPYAPVDAANYAERRAASQRATSTTASKKRPSPTTPVVRPTTFTVPPPSTITATPTQHHINTDNDEMSILTNQTASNLSISAQNTPKKTKSDVITTHPSLNTVQINVAYNSTNAESLATLHNLLQASPFANVAPTDITTSAIVNSDTAKTVHFTFESASTAFAIHQILTTTASTGLQITQAPPALPTDDPMSLFHQPTVNSDPELNYQTRCPYKSCAYSHFANHVYFSTHADYVNHVNLFHQQAYHLLRVEDLERYSIAACTGCLKFFIPEELQNHVNTCPNLRLSQATDESPDPSSQTTDPPTIAPNVIAVCRFTCANINKQAEFESLLQTVATEQELRAHVDAWVLDSPLMNP